MVAVPQVSLAVGGSKVHGTLHSTDLLGAQTIVGGVRSTTVTIWLQVVLLPQRSLTLQVRIARKVLPHNRLVVVLTIRIVTFVPSQESLAVGGVNSHGVPQSKVRLPAQLKLGGVVSTTVTIWLQTAIL